MEELEKIQKEETLKLRTADLLKETTRLAGEFKVNKEVLENDELKEIFGDGANEMTKINCRLAKVLSDLNK